MAIFALAAQCPAIDQHFVNLLGFDFGNEIRISKFIRWLAGRRALEKVKQPDKRSAKNEPDNYVACQIIHITVLSIYPICRKNNLPPQKLR
jgi:hypothetical protein